MQGAPGYDVALRGFVTMLLVHALRQVLASGGETAPGILRGISDPQITRALVAAHRDLGRAWTVESLGRIAGLSRSRFAARFRSALGVAPSAYLAERRLQVAADLILTQAEMPIAAVSAAVGYRSESTFSRAFRRRYGLSPTAYRASRLGAKTEEGPA